MAGLLGMTRGQDPIDVYAAPFRSIGRTAGGAGDRHGPYHEVTVFCDKPTDSTDHARDGTERLMDDVRTVMRGRLDDCWRAVGGGEVYAFRLRAGHIRMELDLTIVDV